MPRRSEPLGRVSFATPLGGRQARILESQPIVKAVGVQVDASSNPDDSANAIEAVRGCLENPPAELRLREWSRSSERRYGT